MATPLDVRLPSPSALGEGLGVRGYRGNDGADDEAITRIPPQDVPQTPGGTPTQSSG